MFTVHVPVIVEVDSPEIATIEEAREVAYSLLAHGSAKDACSDFAHVQNVLRPQTDKSIPADVRARLETTYTIEPDPKECRFVVALIAGYGHRDGVTTPSEAAAACLSLTQDEGASSTHWYVLDRRTGLMHVLEQSEFDPGA